MGASHVPLAESLTEELRAIYAQAPESAAERIRAHLAARLANLTSGEGRRLLLQVQDRLQPVGLSALPTPEKDVAAQVFGLILGRKVAVEDLSSAELIQRLAESLNTIFNELNSLIGLIGSGFSGRPVEAEMTIRQVIGSQIEDEGRRPLEEHLGQIRRAFLTTQEAFKAAAHAKVAQILQSLDPEKLAAERSGGLKIGPMRKAEDFDLLKSKIERIRQWFESGRFMEDFLREFEKNCYARARG